MDELLDETFYGPLRAFSKKKLAGAAELFAQRLALLQTPTARLPKEWIGCGALSLTLPLAVPSIFDVSSRTPLAAPKLWLDLMQRATGKIRWTPIRPARVTVTAFDSYRHASGNDFGVKGVIDALKVGTNGRRDGRPLFYFGAIWDDNVKDMPQLDFVFQSVAHPRGAHCQIDVNPI